MIAGNQLADVALRVTTSFPFPVNGRRRGDESKTGRTEMGKRIDVDCRWY